MQIFGTKNDVNFSGCDKYTEIEQPSALQYFHDAKPSTGGKKDSIDKHLQSKYHERAKNRFQASVGVSAADNALNALNAHTADKMAILFRMIHFLAKECIALTKYSTMRLLHEQETQKPLGIGYDNDEAASMILSYIAKDAFNGVSRDIQESKFLSLTGDDSTDISAIELSVWIVRTCNAGVISNKFIGITGLDKADAPSIVEGLNKLLKKNFDISLTDFGKKLTSVTVDGASVMLGIHTGVATRIKDAFCPWLKTLHCNGHKLELCHKDAVNSCNLVKAVMNLLMQLYKFYIKSALNRANLKNAAHVIDEEVQNINIMSTRGR